MKLTPLIASALLCFAPFVVAENLDAQWDSNSPAQNEARLTAAYSKASDDITRGEILTQVARAQALQARFGDAHRSLDIVRPALNSLPPLISVRYTLERGRTFNQAGEVKKAQRWFRAANLLAQRYELDTFAIESMRLVAQTESGSTALDWNLRALKLAETSPQSEAGSHIGNILNHIGWLYQDQKNYVKALEYLRRSLAWHEERQTGKPLLVARWSLGKLLRLAGDPEKALGLQLEAHRGWLKLNEQDGQVLEEIAENLRELGRRDEAKQYFAQAHRILSQDPLMVRNEGARLNRLQTLSK